MRSGSCFLPAVVVSAFVAACANPGTPTGGPKDRKPPVVVSSVPEQGALDFNGNKITLSFDENIQLKDQDTKFVMSPPLAKSPKLSSHGKDLIVSFDEELMPSTTYTLDFADCVSDLNEGNVYNGLTFSFSTGKTQDSLMISGNLYDAATLAPVEGVYVLLHSDVSDSAFYRLPPVRIAKTDSQGRFAIKSVAADNDYRVFALDDQNRNFLFDQPGERIAWHDASVRPSWEMRQVPDSVLTDSTVFEADSLRHIYKHVLRDTLTLTPDSLRLFLFSEDSFDQYVTMDNRKERNIISLAFNCPAEKRPVVSFVGHDGPASDFAALQFSPSNDTVTIWMTDSLIWKRDSVVISVAYEALDKASGSSILKSDTLTEWHFERKAKEQKSRRRSTAKKTEAPKSSSLELQTTSSMSPLAWLNINSKTPIASFDWRHVRLSLKQDSLFTPVVYTSDDDSARLCHKALKYKWLPGETYHIDIDSAAVYDVYGVCNATISRDVAISPADKFGTIYVDIDHAPANSILQLTDKQGKIMRQAAVPSNLKVGFRYVKPGDYMLRIVVDDNHDGRWTKGCYAERRQPESIVYYMQTVAVRENWDIHVIFEYDKFSPDAYVKKFNGKSSRNRTKK